MNFTLLKDIFDVPEFPINVSDRKNIEQILEDLRKVDPIAQVIRSRKGTLNHVLGIFEGPAFAPDKPSRNNSRVYPKSLWERVVKEVNPYLKSSGRLGYLEHPTEESELNPRNASHVLKRIWINREDKLGYAKLYVVDTPAGVIASTLASATDESGKRIFKFYLSSRGYGREIENSQGVFVDPESYRFDSFDLVVNPGFPEASPEYKEVVEAVNYCQNGVCEILSDEEKGRIKVFIESYTNKQSQTEQVIPIREDYETLKSKYEQVLKENNELKAKIKKLQKKILSLKYSIPIEEVSEAYEKIQDEELVHKYLKSISATRRRTKNFNLDVSLIEEDEKSSTLNDNLKGVIDLL